MTKKQPVPRKGPPTNLRPGGAHADKYEKAYKRLLLAEARALVASPFQDGPDD